MARRSKAELYRGSPTTPEALDLLAAIDSGLPFTFRDGRHFKATDFKMNGDETEVTISGHEIDLSDYDWPATEHPGTP